MALSCAAPLDHIAPGVVAVAVLLPVPQAVVLDMPETGAALGVEAVAGRVGLEVFVVQVFPCTAAEQVASFQVGINGGAALTIAAAGQFPGLVVVIPALQVTAGIVEQFVGVALRLQHP